MSDSEPLTTLMAGGPMPVDEVLRIGREAAAALRDVHGELWPSAISVSSDGIGVVPSGVADRTRYGQYAAPERILGKPATPASDVFSLAAILFHALTGRPPFRGSTPAEVMLSVCADKPIELSSLRPDVPADVAALLQRALSRDIGQRPPSPSVFADLLERVAVKDNFPGKRILVADDETSLRDFYTTVAARIGVEADVVGSGRDVIAALKSRRYDIVFMDLNMPRVSGWEVLDFLRTRHELRPPLLYIVTGFAEQNISAADRELVTAVLYKPVAAEELRALVTACLKGGPVDLPSILRTTGHRILPAA
ncbi:MAG TPA: response regulator [Thermoanaerobaculia bacterium]|nr:response regulator [Thermoanaerobaculia bacterium]